MGRKITILILVALTSLALASGFSIAKAGLVDWSKVESTEKLKDVYNISPELVSSGLEQEKARWEETKRQEEKRAFLSKILGNKWLVVIGIALYIAFLVGVGWLVQYFLKSRATKNVGEVLVIDGFGILTYEILGINRGLRRYYFMQKDLMLISLAVMLIVSGLFIFINKRKNS